MFPSVRHVYDLPLRKWRRVKPIRRPAKLVEAASFSRIDYRSKIVRKLNNSFDDSANMEL